MQVPRGFYSHRWNRLRVDFCLNRSLSTWHQARNSLFISSNWKKMGFIEANRALVSMSSALWNNGHPLLQRSGFSSVRLPTDQASPTKNSQLADPRSKSALSLKCVNVKTIIVRWRCEFIYFLQTVWGTFLVSSPSDFHTPATSAFRVWVLNNWRLSSSRLSSCALCWRLLLPANRVHSSMQGRKVPDYGNKNTHTTIKMRPFELS